MKSIVLSSEKVATAMTEISTASDKQAVSIGQVHMAVAEIDDGIRQNAALVEEASAAAESLKTQTENLNHAIAQFRVTRSPIDMYTLLRPLPWPTA